MTDREVPLLLAVYGTLRRGCRNHHVLAGAEPVADGHGVGAQLRDGDWTTHAGPLA